MVSTPKEPTLGAAVVDEECSQTSAQGKQFAECEKPSGICTNLDEVDSSLEEFLSNWDQQRGLDNHNTAGDDSILGRCD